VSTASAVEAGAAKLSVDMTPAETGRFPCQVAGPGWVAAGSVASLDDVIEWARRALGIRAAGIVSVSTGPAERWRTKPDLEPKS
jgi:hypothetical protein